MKKYIIRMTYEAEKDIHQTYHHIACVFMAPKVALNYRNGIYDTIQGLSAFAGIYAFCQNDYIQSLYGTETYTVHYKKMTVIYNIINHIVLIRRVIPGSLIR